MPDSRFADDIDPFVVGAVEPFESFFDREYPRMVAVAYAVSVNRLCPLPETVKTYLPVLGSGAPNAPHPHWGTVQPP